MVHMFHNTVHLGYLKKSGDYASKYMLEEYIKEHHVSELRNDTISKMLYLCKRIEQFNRLLERNKLPKYLQRRKQFVHEKLIERGPGEILWPQAYDELFERDYNTIGQEIEDFRRERRSR